MFQKVAVKNRLRLQMVQRNVKEPLYLAGVQVHGQYAVGPGGGDKIGHELGTDGRAALMLLVLPGIFALVRAKAGRTSPSMDPDDAAMREV